MLRGSTYAITQKKLRFDTFRSLCQVLVLILDLYLAKESVTKALFFLFGKTANDGKHSKLACLEKIHCTEVKKLFTAHQCVGNIT